MRLAFPALRHLLANGRHQVRRRLHCLMRRVDVDPRTKIERRERRERAEIREHLRVGRVAVTMSGMALTIEKTPRGYFWIADAVDMNDAIRERRQPVRRSPRVRRHAGQPPERHQDSAIGLRRVTLQDGVALTA